MQKAVLWLISLIIISTQVVPVVAINSAYPIKMVELGENIPHSSAYNLDPYNIVPADTMAICHIYQQENFNLTRGDYQYLLGCIGRNPDDPDGSRFRYLGAHFDSHSPAPVGEYYAISNKSPISDYEATLKQIQTNPQAFRDAHLRLYTVLPDPTPIPTTPTIGTLTITSNPVGATIFLDNVIKGITPLTLSSVSNGDHNVLLRLDGYQDSSKSVTILGDTQTLNLVLELKSTQTPTPINTATTGATTIPTTVSVTATTTTGVPTTQITTIATTATPKPTRKVNYSATIATMQSQIAEQNAKIEEQGNILDQITNFLRDVFGWK